jgi:drug/metabolite transporter (DMT)-like permease
VGYVAGGRLSRQIGSLATTFWGLASALLILVPAFAATAGETSWSTVPLTAWLAIAWMALLSSLTGYGLWFFALDRGGIARIGSLQLVLPVATIVAAVMILGEALSVGILVATIAIVVGTWWAHRHAS